MRSPARRSGKGVGVSFQPHDPQTRSDIHHLLDTIEEGDPVAADQLLVLVHSELRRFAAAKMSREAPAR